MFLVNRKNCSKLGYEEKTGLFIQTVTVSLKLHK